MNGEHQIPKPTWSCAPDNSLEVVLVFAFHGEVEILSTSLRL